MADTPTRGSRVGRVSRRAALIAAVLVAALTVGSFCYNLATDRPPPRPSGLLIESGGGFHTRYRAWGTRGVPIVLVPGAFETADTFAPLGAALGRDHRVFAIDLTGTGYSAPSSPFTADHLAAQVTAFLVAKRLTGTDAAVVVGHSSGAAVAGIAALRDSRAVREVVFLDGDATPLAGPSFLGWVLINPYRTTLLRLVLSSGWLIRQLYSSQCGPGCPPLNATGVQTWRLPLEQPGFGSQMSYWLRHGIPSMTAAQFRALRAATVPKLVVYGVSDPQMPAGDAVATAARIGSAPPVRVPGRHLTMISSPRQVAAAVQAFMQTPDTG